MAHQPIIKVLSYAQISSNECHQLMPFYHLDDDASGLAMPRQLADFSPAMKLVKYEDWLRNALADDDERVKVALDNLYNQAINGGVIIATLAQCVPFYTHAHIVRNIILELAAQGESQEGESDGSEARS